LAIALDLLAVEITKENALLAKVSINNIDARVNRMLADLNNTGRIYTKDEIEVKINSVLQKAIVRNTADQTFLEFAGYVVGLGNTGEKIDRDIQAKLLRNMNINSIVFGLAKPEDKKQMILGALDGRTINSIHCAVVSTEALLNNERTKAYLGVDSYNNKEVTVEGIAKDFSKRVVDIVQNEDPKKLKPFLSNLRKGLISYELISDVLLNSYGVKGNAVALTAENLVNDMSTPSIVQAEGVIEGGDIEPHFIAVEAGYKNSNGENAINVQDVSGNFGVMINTFLKYFQGKLIPVYTIEKGIGTPLIGGNYFGGAKGTVTLRLGSGIISDAELVYDKSIITLTSNQLVTKPETMA
ncbi:MAG: hypothetical protein CO035_05890, partial [Candidatus Omnitrophica bacterium CG_4_9_14_0_2_um_filter_42_8]